MNEAQSSRKKALYPVRFHPQYKDYLWGGDRIPKRFGRALPPGRYAESWEISTRPEGMSVAATGPWAGQSLGQLVDMLGAELVGTKCAGQAFPLLLKIIDARETLSVQVHPDDACAAAGSGEAKTEMWYVLDADPGACVYCGLRPGADEAILRRALAEKNLPDLLVRVPVSAGDAIFVPGGRIHAIGAGCLLYECQQNSNTTFRLYDWDRLEPATGQPRDLHVQQSLRVIRWTDADPVKVPPSPLRATGRNNDSLVIDRGHFRVERHVAVDPLCLRGDPATFQALFVFDGALRLNAPGYEETMPAGTSVLIPAALEQVELTPLDGVAFLRITV